MTLKEEIEKSLGFFVNSNREFRGLFCFSQEIGRIVPSSHRNSGKSFWIQDCGTKYILGLWLGYTYHCEKKEDLFTVVRSLLTDSTRSTPHYHMPGNLKKIIQEFDIYDLKRNMASETIQDNSTDDLDDSFIHVPFKLIEEFLLHHNCEYILDKAGWVSFFYEGDRIFFRKSQNTCKKDKTMVNIGIDTKVHDLASDSNFLDDFPRYIMNKGIEFSVKYSKKY